MQANSPPAEDAVENTPLISQALAAFVHGSGDRDIPPHITQRAKLLMLDEPAAGLSPHNVDKLLETVMALKKRFGLTLVIIEHILKVVMDTCDVVSVLEHGEKIAEGAPAAIKDDHRVIEAYLGKEMQDAEVRAYLRG